MNEMKRKSSVTEIGWNMIHCFWLSVRKTEGTRVPFIYSFVYMFGKRWGCEKEKKKDSMLLSVG